jgi:SH3-like domain-containing protein
MSQIVTVKNSPDAKSSDAFVLHGGVKVQLIDSVGGWSKVRIADGKVGWLEASAVEVI